MDFTLSAEQQAIVEIARDLGQEKIAPFAREWDEAGTIPRGLWADLAGLGLGGLNAAEALGGAALGRLEGTLVFEALAMACPSVAAFLSIHNMCVAMVDRFGSDALKARFLPPACRMECIFSYCLTEPGSGSDAAALATRAVPTDDGWRLSGTKSFISGGGYSDLYVVMARTGGEAARGISAFVVEAGAPGLSFGALEKKMGWRAQETRAVHLDHVLVPKENLLGEEGRGFAYAMAGLDGGRLNIAATALGGAQAAFDATLSYMGERRAFGKTLNAFQALQFRLADMETQLQAARIFLRQAAWLFDQGDPKATRFCAMAKLHVTDAAFEVANQCLQLHGGYGYLADYGIEKIVRDLRVHQILEGTNEIMRLIIARELIGDRI
jgi:alkylation response protein AidB-like acyl-CoA dehydrogenase